MVVYHGTIREIKKPQIVVGEIGRDFGTAFYTTCIRTQAERQAVRKANIINHRRRGPKSVPIVNAYNWDEAAECLAIKCFFDPSEEWLDMVVTCRGKLESAHPYAIVIGEIADGDVGEIINYVMVGIMRPEDAIECLKLVEINTQVAFCTEQSLKTLKFLGSYAVEGEAHGS